MADADQNRGYGGGCVLPNGQPIAYYRMAASDAATISQGMFISQPIPLPPVLPADVANVANGFLWHLTGQVYDPVGKIAGQTTAATYTNGGENPLRAFGEGQAFVTDPAPENNMHGAIVLTVWNGGGTGGRPGTFRCADSSNPLGPYVLSCTDPLINALPYTVDALHPVAPAIRKTGLYNSLMPLESDGTTHSERGGQMSGPIIKLGPGHYAAPMNGKLIATTGPPTDALANKSSAVIVHSTDDCQTWDFLALIGDGTAHGSNLLETNIVRRNDGTLYAMHRDGFVRSYSIGTPDGLHWSDPVQINEFAGGSEGRATLAYMSLGDGRFLMLHVIRPIDYGRRADIWGSLDGGLTWPYQEVLSGGTGTLKGSPPPEWLGGDAGQCTYCQLVVRQIRIPKVAGVTDGQRGIVDVFISFSWGTGTAIDEIAAASTAYWFQLIAEP